MGWLNKFGNNKYSFSKNLKKIEKREQEEREWATTPEIGKIATPFQRNRSKIDQLENANAKKLEPIREERKEQVKGQERLKLVIDGATLECRLCTQPKGILKVNFDTPSTQEKRTATEVETTATSLIFNGNCTKSPNSASPCASVMQTGSWKNTGLLKVQEKAPLLQQSTIPCLYGGTDIKITDSGQINEPEVIKTENAPVPDPNKKIKIKSKESSYTVVLDKNGDLFSGFPILEFEIEEGEPNLFIDIQVVKVNQGLLTHSIGLANSWDKTKLPKDRVSVKTFSSYTNGDTTLRLDAFGKATYAMPLDWWRDLARQPLSDFTTMKIYFKVLAFKDVSEIKEESLISHVDVSNNLVSFELNDFGYVGVAKNISMEFTVKQPNTTEMYTFVQWMQGSFKMWNSITKEMSYPSPHILYGMQHIANFPDKTIDRVGINPRYWDGIYNISNGNKTATATDAPSGNIPPNCSHMYIDIDFETRLHLNYDVPASVTITKQEGIAPIYGIITGVLSDPQPIILKNAFWKTQVLQVRNVLGNVKITTDVPFNSP